METAPISVGCCEPYPATHATSLPKIDLSIGCLMNKILKTLNEPFILWLLSSVVIGALSWQYTEIQEKSATNKLEQKILRRAQIELNLLTLDVELFSSSGDELTVLQLGSILRTIQYSGVSQTSAIYVPSIQNVMLEIDSRTGSCGLEMYQEKIYTHIVSISRELNRLSSLGAPPNARIRSDLSDETTQSLKELPVLVDEIREYYKTIAPECSIE